ncbi:MAG: metal ABC transporter ATP-binding protein [Acutalibacteraceae bacterium]|jgi:zinc transport system ATP-binding protein
MESALKIENLSVSYSNTDAVKDVSLTIQKGEYVNIVGPNGGGKTTLIKAVLGLIKPDSGTISICGKGIDKGLRQIGYVPQNAVIDRDFPITVLETVQTAFLKPGLNPLKKFSQTEREQSFYLLELLGIKDLYGCNVSELSGGQFQRLLIARALAKNPEILLLDEPTANIDPASADKIYGILAELNRTGCTVIMVSHDLRYVLQSGRRTVYINRNVLYDGPASEEIYKL